jgi:hypothetical protein
VTEETKEDSKGGKISAEQLAKTYIKIRDAKQEEYRRYMDKSAEYQAQMDAIAAELLDMCKALDVTSMRTDEGTIIRKVSTRYATNDWDSLYKFIQEHNAFGLLSQTIHQNNTKQFLEENPDLLPPGMWADSKYTIVVKRS